ncbi:MAG: sugar phosphate isomerase/epimerase [bacterium]|nr:sugar phosphate isomerase/epimerase [bacterium]
MGSLPFALQLYTVRDHCEKDFAGTLAKVKGIGYDHVELAGYHGVSPAEARALVDAAGLTPVSAHVDPGVVCAEPERVVDELRAVGVEYGVVSGGAEDKAGWEELARGLDKGGAVLREAGCTLCYHNHAHEFVQFDGQTALDLIYELASPENLSAQIDAYWVKDGGADPVAIINQYAARCPLLHVKDMTAGDPHTYAEVGQGIIDWPPVFEAGKAAGVKWYIVEQDESAGDSLDSARISAEFMARQ